MKIAVICWGPIYSDKGSLKTSGDWKNDGPSLQLEFCRFASFGKSKERVTVALAEGFGEMCVTYWDLMVATDLKSAMINLRDREGSVTDEIHSYTRNQNPLSHTAKQIETWLTEHPEVDAVIWTGLTSNWRRFRNTEFTAQDFEKYLDSKKHSLSEIKKYFDKVPPQTQTVGRAVFEKWCKTQGA